MTTLEWPPLFKKTSTGKIQGWWIRVDGSTILTRHGQVGGKMQDTTDVITKGKNIGRSNETTPAEQAASEAQSRWEKKQKSNGYHQTCEAAQNEEVNSDFVEGGALPMLAHVYEKRGKNIVFPAFVQPKLDGHRCIAIVDDNGDVTLWSRTRKAITGVPHIAKAVKNLKLPAGTILDGELYNHDYREKFDELTSFIRQATPKDGHEVVQYHVYDIINDDLFVDRTNALEAAVLSYYGSEHAPIVYVETAMVAEESEMFEAFTDYLGQGYEGLMVRNMNSKYAGKRSVDLQKVKMMQDFEAEVIDVVSGRGKMEGKGVFVCRTGTGQTFKAKMVGPIEDLAEYLDNKDLYIGRKLTVQYQDLTIQGVPRFPVGLRFRDDL